MIVFSKKNFKDTPEPYDYRRTEVLNMFVTIAYFLTAIILLFVITTACYLVIFETTLLPC